MEEPDTKASEAVIATAKPTEAESLEKKAVATVVDSRQLDDNASKLAQEIIKSKTPEDMDKYVNMFELNIAKKNALRILTLNSLLDKVNDQATERFNKHPEEITNKELLDYMDVVQNSIDRAEASLKNANNPASSVTSMHNEVNINMGSGMNEESRTKVVDAVTSLLAHLGDADKEDKKEDTEKTETIDMTASSGDAGKEDADGETDTGTDGDGAEGNGSIPETK